MLVCQYEIICIVTTTIDCSTIKPGRRQHMYIYVYVHAIIYLSKIWIGSKQGAFLFSPLTNKWNNRNSHKLPKYSGLATPTSRQNKTAYTLAPLPSCTPVLSYRLSSSHLHSHLINTRKIFSDFIPVLFRQISRIDRILAPLHSTT